MVTLVLTQGIGAEPILCIFLLLPLLFSKRQRQKLTQYVNWSLVLVMEISLRNGYYAQEMGNALDSIKKKTICHLLEKKLKKKTTTSNNIKESSDVNT